MLVLYNEMASIRQARKSAQSMASFFLDTDFSPLLGCATSLDRANWPQESGMRKMERYDRGSGAVCGGKYRQVASSVRQ